jgi:hypothetical protein
MITIELLQEDIMMTLSLDNGKQHVLMRVKSLMEVPPTKFNTRE